MLHLASRSPRRRELLARLGVPFVVLDVEVPEVRGAHESPQAYVARVAADKAGAGLEQLGPAEQAAVIGADTEVVLDGEGSRKPAWGFRWLCWTWRCRKYAGPTSPHRPTSPGWPRTRRARAWSSSDRWSRPS